MGGNPHFSRTRFRARMRALLGRRVLVAGALSAAAGSLLTATYVLAAAPDDPADYMRAPGSAILGARGEVIERDLAEGMRIPVTLDAVAPAMIEATVATEDRRFRRHPGIDPLAVARAAWRYREERSGASTITQQLVRNTYLAEAETPLLLRKGREMWLALRVEAHHSKDEILERYLNVVYYGRGAYGVEAAARVYFGTGAGHLDLAQAAFLAGLPQSPSRYDSPAGAREARARQAYVLERMVATGAIDAEAAEAARETRLAVVPADVPAARHLAALAYDEIEAWLPDARERDGLVIQTTIDVPLQRAAERSVTQRLRELEREQATSAAVVAIDPRDGRLLALVGSADYEAEAGQINMALEPRQPGSALKPFLYAAALERGFTAGSMLLDVPVTYDTPSGPYAPVNYDLRFRGPVSLRVALASSLNVPAVRTQQAIGMEALLDVAHRHGLATLSASEVYGPALTLGGGDVRLIDLTSAYAALAASGERRPPWVVERVLDHTGAVLYERREEPPVAVLDERIAFVLTDILADSAARQPGFGGAMALRTPFEAAVKTGTSSDFRDNWTLGYTPDRAVGVWVGNADQSPMVNVSGLTGAAPIWRDVMVSAMEDRPHAAAEPPPGLVRLAVCTPTGLLPGPDCPSPLREWFLEGTEPGEQERYYHRDAAGRVAIDPPTEARTWAIDAGWVLAPGEAGGGEAVQIVSPRPGAVVYRAPELTRQEMLLRASVPPGTERVDFFVNGQLVGTASRQGARMLDARITWPLEPGQHQVRVAAHLPGGETVEATAEYEVRER